MFSDNRRDSNLVVYFPLAMVLRDLIAGLFVGVQEGEWRGPRAVQGRQAVGRATQDGLQHLRLITHL